jgi:hypothetical protein
LAAFFIGFFFFAATFFFFAALAMVFSLYSLIASESVRTNA